MSSSTSRQLVNDDPKYKDIHETYSKVLDLREKYDIDVQDLLIILQHELNKININNKPKNKTEIEQKLDELFQCVHIMKHPSSIITWKALVALARDIHCHFNSVSLNHVTKFFLESTTYDNNNKRKCKMFWDDPKADVQQFMESVDFVLCVNYIKNTHMKVVWIKKKSLPTGIYALR